jgi:hypothetical protein
MTQRDRFRVHRGFLTAGPTLDSLPTRRHRDEEEEPDAIEIHNHIPVRPGRSCTMAHATSSRGSCTIALGCDANNANTDEPQHGPLPNYGL